MKIVYPNKSHFESIVPITFENLLKALVPISFEICPPVLTNTKILWKLSIQMKITSNQLFPSSLRIRWKLESQSSLKSVRCDWQKLKTFENCLFHQHGWSIQLGKWKIDKNCFKMGFYFQNLFPLVWTVSKCAFVFKICFLQFGQFQNALSFSNDLIRQQRQLQKLVLAQHPRTD